MTTPWLSIVMPTYNGAEYLSSALASVQVEGDEGVEVIAIDDGSSDGTPEILESFSERMAVRVVRLAHNGNWAANSNMGLALARAERVSFLHQDDFWFPGRLAAIRALVAEFPQAGLYLFPSWFVNDQGVRLGRWRCPLPARRPITTQTLLDRLLVQNFIAASSPVFRRDAAERVGGLDPDLWYAADWDFWLKLAGSGEAVYSPRPLLAYRLHVGSITVRQSSRTEQIRDQLLAVLSRHLPIRESLGECHPRLARICRISAELNVAMFRLAGRRSLPWAELVRRAGELNPSDWYHYLRNSRMSERIFARGRLFLQMLREGWARPTPTPTPNAVY
jgi:glycosyltransferase involved in cell wall biosynthesis